MTDAVLIALVATFPPTVIAMAGIAIAVVNNRKADEKIEHVTVLTNSTLLKANQRIAELESKIERMLKDTVADVK